MTEDFLAIDTLSPATRPNPFADFGRPVSGERFVGRREILRALDSRVIQPPNPGNLALVGEPRVGKSSIAHHAIRCQRDKLARLKKVALWLNVGLFPRGWDLFRALVEQTMSELSSRNWLEDSIEKSANKCRAFEDLDGESQSWLLEFFCKVRTAGFRVVAVLDEFDGASSLWSKDRPGFQLLRELSYDPASSLSFVTTSRREVKDIETQTGVISNFAGTFKKCYVRPFDDDDFSVYVEKLSGSGVTLTPQEVVRWKSITGAHPLFLDIAAYELIESQAIAEDERLRILEETVPLQFVDTYIQHLQLLKDDGTLPKLMQILFGPVIDVNAIDVDRLVRYGVIKKTESGYEAYSDHFQGFLRCTATEVDPWPLWRDTERGLREVVAIHLCEEYGQDWTGPFVKARPKYAGLIQQWDENRRKERMRYGELASEELLDYTYPAELFEIMKTDWTWFGKVLGGQPNDWSRVFQILAKVRTPLAHNRTSPAYEGIIDEATGICKQILSKLTMWKRTRQERLLNMNVPE
jgi:hypothetical protein